MLLMYSLAVRRLTVHLRLHRWHRQKFSESSVYEIIVEDRTPLNYGWQFVFRYPLLPVYLDIEVLHGIIE